MKLTRSDQHRMVLIVPDDPSQPIRPGCSWLLALAWQRIAKRRAEQLRLIEEQEKGK